MILPLNIAQRITQSSKIKSISLYLSLRMMYESSSIHSFDSRIKELEDYTGLNRKTIRKHLKTLLEDDLVFYNKKNLVLRGRQRFCELFGLRDQSHYLKIKLPVSTKVKDIIFFIRKRAVEEVLNKQHYRTKEVIENPSGKSDSRVKKKQARSTDFMVNDVNDRRPQLSHRRIAQMMGCKWHSSGTYHIRKLEQLGYLRSHKMDDKFIMKGNGKLFHALQDNYLNKSFYITKCGNIYERRTNRIEIL